MAFSTSKMTEKAQEAIVEEELFPSYCHEPQDACICQTMQTTRRRLTCADGADLAVYKLRYARVRLFEQKIEHIAIVQGWQMLADMIRGVPVQVSYRCDFSQSPPRCFGDSVQDVQDPGNPRLVFGHVEEETIVRSFVGNDVTAEIENRS